MAGHARYTAILDACVLFPPAVADALISLYVAGRYTARRSYRAKPTSQYSLAIKRSH